jgi:hypothetical protein
MTSVLATLQISPHIVRPGKVITARLLNFSCVDIPLTGPCPVGWNPTGPGHAIGVASYLTPITRCGKLDHICKWRVSKHAPTTRYDVLGLNITRTVAQANGGDFSAIITDYVGILGPKPPPAPPKPSHVVGPPSGVVMPPVPPPHRHA